MEIYCHCHSVERSVDLHAIEKLFYPWVEKFHEIPEHGLVRGAYSPSASYHAVLYNPIELDIDRVLAAPTIEHRPASPHLMSAVLCAQSP
jgi:hypothetical protein